MDGKAFMIAVTFLVVPGPSCTNSDNYALLIGTLKTVQRAVCDDETVSLACPGGTTITIQVAQYGMAAPEEEGCVAETASSVERDKEKCKWPNSMQYSLLQTVVQACQKKLQCKFSTKPKPGQVDPCPLARKYIDVSYKCRPHEFRSRTVCENEVAKLSCNPHSRISILDALCGRTEQELIACPQTQGMPNKTCSAPHAAEKVMQLCLGKRRCQIVANSNTFNSPCTHTRPHLKVIYTCVPLGVLSDRYESAKEKDEMEVNTYTDKENFFDESEGSGERWRESSVGVPIADPALQPPPEDVTKHVPSTKAQDLTIHHTIHNEERNKDTSSSFKYFIYIGIAVLIFVVLLVIFIGIRCYVDRHDSRKSKNGDMFTTEAPNVFNDAASDVDNDIDVSHISGTFYDPLHPDLILYRDVPGVKGTLRAMRPLSTVYPCAGASMYGNIDHVPSQSRQVNNSFTRSRSKEEQMDPEVVQSPKSLGTYSNSRFYYG